MEKEKTFGENLIESLDEVLQHLRGEIELTTYEVDTKTGKVQKKEPTN